MTVLTHPMPLIPATTLRDWPSDALTILGRLSRHPSRASAAAIGQHFVLNKTSLSLALEGMDALCDMVCDWTIVFLEEVVGDPATNYLLRRQALHRMNDLMLGAIRRGYDGLSRSQCLEWTEACRDEIDVPPGKDNPQPFAALDVLGGHLAQAVADGFFGELPDF